MTRAGVIPPASAMLRDMCVPYMGSARYTVKILPIKSGSPPRADSEARNVVSHNCKCIFVHVPKTAGRSIEQFFLDYLRLTWNSGGELLLKTNDDPRLGPHVLHHLSASQYLACGHVTKARFDEYFKFAFVRNPWDRVVSEYKFRDYPKKFDFKTYLFKHWPKPAWNNLYLHVIPQYAYLFDDRGNLVVDFVGRFETLREDFDAVCGKLGIDGGPLPRVNRSVTTRLSKRAVIWWLQNPLGMYRLRRNVFDHYTEYYDDKAREFVSAVFRQDIDAFQYEFGARDSVGPDNLILSTGPSVRQYSSSKNSPGP